MALHTNIINFGKGQPSLSLLPLAAWRTATDHCLAQGDAELLQYGVDEGDEGFRHALAQLLSRRYAIPVTAAELVVSAGASQALDLVCTRFARRGDTIFVEEPTYFLALEIFRDHGLQVVGIPIDDDGIRIDALQDALLHHRPAFLYTVPSFQNPSGTTMSAARREQLMAVSQANELLIVADEVYQLLDFGTVPPPPLAAHCHAARVLSLGSFSKICAPGLRLGWIQGAPDLLHTITRSGVVQSGGGLSPFVSGVMRSLIDLGLADVGLDGLRRVYTERSAVLCRALRELLPTVTFVEPAGGYFVWAQLPAGRSAMPSAVEFLPRAMAGGVSFHPGARFSRGGGFAQHIRLSFAYYDAPELEEGVRRLARALTASAA
jgi:2-aminoadipate transaminase